MTADDWRERHAAALDFEVGELEKLLGELDNGHAIALTRGRGQLCTEIRQLASAVRAEISSMVTEARELRRDPADQVVLPMTARFVR